MPHRYRFLIVALLAVAGSAAAPLALAEPHSKAPGNDARGNDPDAQVCKRIKVTGSHTRQRVCHTRREWDRVREASQEALRNTRAHQSNGREGD